MRALFVVFLAVLSFGQSVYGQEDFTDDAVLDEGGLLSGEGDRKLERETHQTSVSHDDDQRSINELADDTMEFNNSMTNDGRLTDIIKQITKLDTQTMNQRTGRSLSQDV
ncbi:uncharacterized protein LOC121373539 [Gigantopelta aegis]|uniref:uncharacterized protein LOC121373539 n=1 Tax=Gigantopelta aegis TaxID=1735272 RepID=UPI001B88DF50|nr:uncharacterized protein LOC121373539 [Gigantopelta aegis]